MYPVVSVVTVIIKRHKINDFKKYIIKLTKSAKKEPGNILYQWSHIGKKSNKFQLVQIYINYDWLIYHTHTDIIKLWESKTKYEFLKEKETFWVSNIKKGNTCSIGYYK